MTLPLRAFLMLRSPDGQWDVSVFNNLDGMVAAWDARPDIRISGVVHVGFWRPASQLFEELASSREGKLLLTGSARYCLPDGFVGSQKPIGYVEGLPVHLALRGWGYLDEDPSPEMSIAAPAKSEPTGWVKTYLESNGGHAEALETAGIWNDETYLACEASLPRNLRHQIGLFRFKLSPWVTSENPNEYLADAPPWLLDLPFAKINLTVRVSNAFAAHGMTHVRNLLNSSSSALLHLQNFGRKSLNDLRDALSDALTVGPLPDETTLLGNDERLLIAVERSLGGLDERLRDILIRRMGFRRPKQTLQEIGDEYAITRERIRQLESKALQAIEKSDIWARTLVKKLGVLVVGRDFPLPVLGLEAIDTWFEGVGKFNEAVKYILASLCDDEFKVVRIDDIEFVARVSQDEWESYIREGRRLLAVGAESSWSETHCRAVIDAILDERRQEFRSLLWREASHLCKFSEDGGLGRTLVAYGRGADQVVEAVLFDSDEPLHFSEIAKRASERSAREIDVRRAHNAAATVGILLGRGIYGTARHIVLSDDVKNKIRDELEQIILEGPDERQWHSSELLTIAVERAAPGVEGLSKYIVDYILSSSPALQRLGRMVWSKAESSLASRIDVRQAVASLLIRAGEPLSTDEIRQRLIAQRGLGSNFQVISDELVIRLGSGMWGLNDRDLSIKKADQPTMVEFVFEELCKRGVGIHISEVNSVIQGTIRGSEHASQESIFSLCLLDSRLQISASEYLFVREWKEPRRVRASEAIQRVLSAAGSLSTDGIISAVQTETRRPATRREIVLLLRANNAKLNESDDSWSLQVAEEEIPEITVPSRALLAPIDWTT